MQLGSTPIEPIGESALSMPLSEILMTNPGGLSDWLTYLSVT